MTPMEVALCSGSSFFAVRRQSRAGVAAAAPSVLVLDTVRGEVRLLSDGVVQFSLPLADLAPLCLGYRVGRPVEGLGSPVPPRTLVEV